MSAAEIVIVGIVLGIVAIPVVFLFLWLLYMMKNIGEKNKWDLLARRNAFGRSRRRER